MWYQYCPHFSPTAAFPDNVVFAMSPFLADVGISGYTVVPALSPFFTDNGISG
jgi:hypothetical protein